MTVGQGCGILYTVRERSLSMIKFTDKMLCALSTRGRYVAARRMYTYNPAEKVVHVWERNVELGDFEEVTRQRYDVEAHIAMRGCKV